MNFKEQKNAFDLISLENLEIYVVVYKLPSKFAKFMIVSFVLFINFQFQSWFENDAVN